MVHEREIRQQANRDTLEAAWWPGGLRPRCATARVLERWPVTAEPLGTQET
jgi:hypothetical protein